MRHARGHPHAALGRVSRGRPGPDLRAESRLVPLAQLREELPPETHFVSAAERAQQLARRAASYAWRLAEE